MEKGREGTFMAISHGLFFFVALLSGGVSGWLLGYFCPAEGERNSELMWLIIALFAMLSPVLMIVFRKFSEIPTNEIQDKD